MLVFKYCLIALTESMSVVLFKQMNNFFPCPPLGGAAHFPKSQQSLYDAELGNYSK